MTRLAWTSVWFALRKLRPRRFSLLNMKRSEAPHEPLLRSRLLQISCGRGCNSCGSELTAESYAPFVGGGRIDSRAWRPFGVLWLVAGVAMVAVWTLRLYSDWRSTPQPHVVEGLLLSAALPLYLLAIVLGIRAVRQHPSVLTTAFIVGA